MGSPNLSHGLRAARRLALLLAALLLISLSPVATGAAARSAPTSPTAAPQPLGHARLTVHSNLRAASHVSAWAIDEWLAQATPLPPLGHAFKAAEAKYDLNAVYLLAHAMHETGFGTSWIGQHFHNLFGWNAIDRNPVAFATRFRTYARSIDYVASQVSELYLTPGGRYYGGSATLHGMRHYASDPMWDQLVARIANNIVLPTLAGRHIAFAAPVVGQASTGRPVDVTVTAGQGDLPDGLEAVYRFVPVAIVEAGVSPSKAPAVDPAFRLATGASLDGVLELTVTAPTRPGRYRLELQLRDSDGTKLTERGVPRIRASAVRVYGSDAVSYGLTQQNSALALTVTNSGRRVIPVGSAVPGGAAAGAGATAQAEPTTLTAWLVPDIGTPALLATVLLDHPIPPGGTWTAPIPLPTPDGLPGVLVVRLDVGGEPGRLGGAPPGVFALSVAGVTALNQAAPAALRIVPLTPTDAASRMLLRQGTSAGVGGAPGTGSANTAKAGAVTTEPADAALTYSPIVDPNAPGVATIQIANVGGMPLVPMAESPRGAAAPGPGQVLPALPAGGTLIESPGAGSDGQPRDPPTGPVLAATLVPAWGPATDPVLLLVPLGNLAAGQQTVVNLALPPSTVGASTYLVVVRVFPGIGRPPYPSTLFWIRSAAPAAGAPVLDPTRPTGTGNGALGSGLIADGLTGFVTSPIRQDGIR
jgi:hypothetical protein